MDKRVSVIMPTYQRASLIGRAIGSVLGQRGLGDWQIELIVVDDGSTDTTKEVVSSLQVPVPHQVRYLRLPHRGKPGLVRNAGLRVATGAYIGYCDSDDIWLPHHLATCLSEFARYPDLAMVETWWSFQTLEQSLAGWTSTYGLRPYAGPWWLATTTNSRLHTATVLHQVGFFTDKEWTEDLELWTRISLAGPVRRVRIPTTVNSYIKHGNNLTYRFEPEIAREFNPRTTFLGKCSDGAIWLGKRLGKGLRHPSWLVSRLRDRFNPKGVRP